MANPWLTTDALIAAIKRKIAVPISQVTFTEEDIIAFLNEEMMISTVPSVMSFHEEYFVSELKVPIVEGVNKYPIPERAIGSKLRDLFWSDTQNNFFEMTRVSSEDKAYFQDNLGSNQVIHKYYLEGNDIVLTPQMRSNPTGSLCFFYFLRPNQLVKDDQAAIITNFTKYITIDNTTLVAGNKITIDGVDFEATAGIPTGNQFQIGGTSIVSATNLVNAITTNGVVTASNGTPATAVITLKYDDLELVISSNNSSAISIQTAQGIEFDEIPTSIVNGSVVDFLQTKPGHRLYDFDITIPNNAISGSIISFTSADVPENLIIGDYVCLSNECIIPQIPTDLHNGLVERTCSRILAAMGDQQGLENSMRKIQELEVRQGTLIDSRVDGSCQKITNKNSLLRMRK